jgi:uncharacterized protein YdeI (YjbR/CyaY-like superfamily)
MEISGEPHRFSTAEEWRAWLEANHASEKEAWVIIAKKHAKVSAVTLEEATDEALSFGWIDSSMKPIDAETYTPERNRRRAAELIAHGRMTEAGLAKIAEAKQTGKWNEAT